MDVMSEILASLRLTTTILSRAHFSAPWAVHTKGTEGAIFHTVLEGPCWATHLPSGDKIRLETGDVVLIPGGDPHVMADHHSTPPVALTDLSEKHMGDDGILSYGGEGHRTDLICGTITLDHAGAENFTALLPQILRLSHTQTEFGSWIHATSHMIAAELKNREPGFDTAITRLTDVLVVYLLRAYVTTLPPGSKGWLVATRNAHIGRALALIHQQPGKKWTAVLLARKVGLSRSAFFARFTELVGEPPAQYLTRWRMSSAADALGRSRVGIAELAGRLGYGSDEGFGRAFKRIHGMSPSAYRKQTMRVA